MPRALSQRASQKPSRPASKATAMREILCPDLTASSRQRLSNVRRAFSSVFNFLSGWRSTPGTIPATNQLERLNSTTAINVVSMSRAIRDRLRSFGLRCRGMEGLRYSVYIRADGYNLLAARPIESAQEQTSVVSGIVSGCAFLTRHAMHFER